MPSASRGKPRAGLDNAAAWLLEGNVCRRYWLATIDDDARDHAIVCLARSARLAPTQSVAGCSWRPCLIDAGEFEPAYSVAVLAARAARAT